MTRRYCDCSAKYHSRKSIGRYTILGTLGRGGQADVYRGVHPTLPIEVVIGAILYRLLVGSSPYPAMPMMQLLQCVRESNWDRDSLESADLPESLKAICRRAIASEPNDRFGAARELASALDEAVVIQHAPIAVAPTQTNPWIVRLAIAGLLFVVAGFAYMATRPSTLQPSASLATNNSPIVVTDSNTNEGLIERFDLIHIGNSTSRAEFSGSLMQFRPPRELDEIQVVAEFTEPIY